MTRLAVFLDRDGVLIRDVDWLTRPDQIDVYPYTLPAVRRLQDAGFALVVVTNQPVVARGMITEQGIEAIHDHLQQLLELRIDRFYFCPHHPNALLSEYRQECTCRKPRPGMLLQAARDLNLDLNASWMIGDRPSDVVAGQRAGCKTILVETGMHTAPLIQSSAMPTEPIVPHYVCADLREAVEIILNR